MRRLTILLFAILLVAASVPLLMKHGASVAVTLATSLPKPIEKKTEKAQPAQEGRSPAANPKLADVKTAIDVQSEMEQIGVDWDKAREDLYSRFNLTEQQQAQIQDARSIYNKTVDGFAKNLSLATDQDRDRLIAKIVETGIFYDRAMTEIVGEKNFEALEGLRDSYNEYLDNHSSLRPRLTHRW